MASLDPRTVALRFNLRITARDLEGLCALMTEDHVFIDAAGTRIEGREQAQAAWQRFFEAFADYENVFGSIACDGDRVSIAGHSTCSDARLAGPALWSALVRGERVAEWRVYDDTPAARSELGLSQPEPAEAALTRSGT
jgi:ketosteroid isomerase-like protein